VRQCEHFSDKGEGLIFRDFVRASVPKLLLIEFEIFVTNQDNKTAPKLLLIEFEIFVTHQDNKTSSR